MKIPALQHKVKRFDELDIMRGLMMILMAIDHAGVFLLRSLHLASESWDLPMLTHPNVLSFFTRNITHLVAPGFAFLMGTGMVLLSASRRQKGWSKLRIFRFFAIRGLLLIVAEQILVNPAWLLQYIPGSIWTLEDSARAAGASDVSGVFLAFGILFCLGAVMVVWSGLIHLEWKLIVVICVFSLLSVSFFVPPLESAKAYYHPLYRIMMIGGITPPVSINFPIVPWFGVAGLGILYGRLLLKNRKAAYRVPAISGAVALVLFILLRSLGGFGNIHPASGQSVQSFFMLTKYPPSLVFLLLYLGLCFLILAGIIIVVRKRPGCFTIIGNYGKSAFFFYVTHLYVYGGISILIWLISPFRGHLALVYPFWLIGLAILYPLCLLYYNFKRQRPIDSIWRFF